jgi:hypothetical protein
MSKRKKILIMSIAITPVIAVSCWLIYIGRDIAGAALFSICIIFGNWFVWYSVFRKQRSPTGVKN